MLLVMTDTLFDPFNDRLARDIRNRLTRTLVGHLATCDLAPVRREAATLLATLALATHHRAYIDDRLRRYEAACAAIRTDNLRDPFRRALVLWNQGLFFEFHEIIEEIWHNTRNDPEKQALQALIRAAGVYVHLAAGRPQVAARMAAKATSGLIAHGPALPVPLNLAPLIRALAQLQPLPPPLRPSG